MDIHRCRFVDYTPASISALAFSERSTAEESPASLRLALGRDDGTIEIWKPNTSAKKWYMESEIQGGRGRSIEGLVWGAEGRLFSIGGSTYLTEWDVKAGIPVKNYDCNSGVAWSCEVNASQTKIAVGCDNGTVVVVSIEGGRGVIEHETVLQKQSSRVLSLCWVEDHVIGGCADGRIRCWSYTTKQIVQALRVDRSQAESTLVWSVLGLPARNQFVSGDSTGSVKFWDLNTMTLSQSFDPHDADVLCLAGNADGTKVFAGGVDKAISEFTFTQIKSSQKRWVQSARRTLHTNDIRAMSGYQSDNLDFVISGGAEKAGVLVSLTRFAQAGVVKLPINRWQRNVVVNAEKRLVVMWQGQEVKIWQIKNGVDTLMSKLTLSDPENISSIALSKNGRYLAVARVSTIKLFELIDVDGRLQVAKVPSALLSQQGASMIRFADESKLLLLYTYEGGLVGLKFNTDDDEDEDEPEEMSEFDDNQTPTEYDLEEIQFNQMVVSSNGTLCALSCPDGSIYTVDLTAGKSTLLVKMEDTPAAINFRSQNNNLLVATMSNHLYEFNTTGDSLYTEWSKANTNNVPPRVSYFKGQPYGLFEAHGNFWVYGADWVYFYDGEGTHEKGQNKKKRDASGNAVKGTGAGDSPAFWSSKSYKGLLLVDKFNDDELVVVERPIEELPTTAAFNSREQNHNF